MIFKKALVICVLVSAFNIQNINGVPNARRRSRTSTTTTEPSTPEELTLAEREANLLDREEAFKSREASFRLREETLSQREEAFKGREERISQREKNIEKREQNTVRSPAACPSVDGSGEPVLDFTEVRYDSETRKIQDIGQVGSCGENMRFFANPDNETEGVCDCDYHQCSRPLLYSEKYKQCFWAWSQGPCEQKEWFTYDENLSPICEATDCPESQAIGTPSYYFKHSDDKKCYKAGSKGPCTKKNERLFTVPEDPLPKCRAQAMCHSQTIPATQLCIPGNKRHFDGLCNAEEVE